MCFIMSRRELSYHCKLESRGDCSQIVERVQVAAPISIFTSDRNSEKELPVAFSQNKNPTRAWEPFSIYFAVQKPIRIVLDVYSVCVNFTYHLSPFCPEWPFYSLSS